MTDTAEVTSDQDANDHYSSYTELVGDYLEVINDNVDDDDALEENLHYLECMMLARDEHRVIDVCLATGGPAVHVLYHIKDKEIINIVFKFVDWFYVKEFKVSPGSKEWAIWEDAAQYFIIDILEEW